MRPHEPSPVLVEPVDLDPRTCLFDGLEPSDGSLRFAVPGGPPRWSFTLHELGRGRFADLEGLLGGAAFAGILAAHGFRVPRTPVEVYVGTDRLALHYVLREDDDPEASTLLVVAFGEFQPARYVAHLEGIWRLRGVGPLTRP